MGKKKYCTYCSYWGSSNRVVEIPGCKKCHDRHEGEVCDLKAKLTFLELETGRNKKKYEDELCKTLAKSSQELLNQKAEYERVLSELKFKSSLEVNEKDDNYSHQQKAGKSPVFKKIVLESETKELKRTKEIKIDDISYPVLEAVVDFCYSGEFTFSDLVRPEEVLRAAYTLELGLLRECCEDKICKGLSIDNVPWMLKLDLKFEATRLQEEAGKLFKEHVDILNSKVYEVLEGPDNCTISIAESSSGACPELDEQCQNEI